jgi:thiamine monophosphate synthase
LNSDGIYLSAYNKSLKALSLKNKKFEIIGSAHNFHEISLKLRQGCSKILFSKLFLVNYDKKAPFLGIIKFNNVLKIYKNLIPLGGINLKNLNSLNFVNSEGFALFSEIKKKPANIINRLF